MLKIFCPKHPRYTGQTSPRCSCEQCQALAVIRTTAALEHLGIGNATPKDHQENDP